MLIVFASIPGWANGTPAELGIIDKNAAKPPTKTQFFRDFVTAVVTRFRGRVSHYEIWNEPNYKEFWNGPYDQFIDEILISGGEAVKAADPAAKRLGPATDRSPAKFETAAAKACRVLDALSCHLYVANAATLLRQADETYRPILARRCDKPLWVTEFGIDSWQTGDEAQARELAAAFDGLRNRSYLERLFLFEWRDGYWPYKGQKGWGLVTNSIEGFRRKPSFWAVQELALKRLGSPGVAQAPEPADGATHVPLAAPLVWRAGRGARSHRLSEGVESPAFQREQADRTFPAATPREPGRSYLWRVDEVGTAGTTDGNLWRFTTQEDPAARVPVVVRVEEARPFFLAVEQGQGHAECTPVRSLVRPGTPAEAAKGAWSVEAPAAVAFLSPLGTAAAADELTILLSGLLPREPYRVFGRFVTTPQMAARQAGIRMGLDRATMALFRPGTSGATLVRKEGRWEEREVLIGSARAEGGKLRVLLDGKGLEEFAGWSGLRLEQEDREL